jgi:hypothetical protein
MPRTAPNAVGYIFKSGTDRRHYVLCLKCWIFYGDFYEEYVRNNDQNRLFPIYESQLDGVTLTCVYAPLTRTGNCLKVVGNGSFEPLPVQELGLMYQTLHQMEEV